MSKKRTRPNFYCYHLQFLFADSHNSRLNRIPQFEQYYFSDSIYWCFDIFRFLFTLSFHHFDCIFFLIIFIFNNFKSNFFHLLESFTLAYFNLQLKKFIFINLKIFLHYYYCFNILSYCIQIIQMNKDNIEQNSVDTIKYINQTS